MNIFNKIALQGLKKNRTRTFVTIVGVVLSSLMITGVATFGVSLMDYMARGAMQNYGTWNAAFLDADNTFVKEQQQNPDVADTVTFENIGYAKTDSVSDPAKPYLFIAGFSQEAFDSLRTTLISGRLPQNGSEIIVSAKIAMGSDTPYQVGDTISLSVGDRVTGDQKLTQASPFSSEEAFIPRKEKTYTIVGLCRTPVFEQEGAPGYTAVTRSDVADPADSLSLFVTMQTPRKVYSYVEEAGAGHAYILNYDVLRILGISDRPSDQVFMAFLYSFAVIVLAIIMVGSIFLIYNSFSISLSERIREIGVLASVGATGRQLRNSVLFEGLCIGAVGIPVGILTGLGCISLVLTGVSGRFGSILYSGVPLTTKISPLAVGGAAVISLVTILLSAYLPARKAVNLPVMECIRQTNEIKTEAKTMKISKRQTQMYGLEGTLALKNFKRNRKRYRSIILSLVLSIVLFVTTNAMTGSLGQSAGNYKTVSDYDIGFGSKMITDEELLNLFEKTKHAENVTDSSLRLMIPYSCTINSDELSDAYWEALGENVSHETTELPIKVHFLDDDSYRGLAAELGLSAGEYAGPGAKFFAIAKINSDNDDVKGASDLADLFNHADVNLTITPKLTDDTATAPEENISVTAVEFIPPDIAPVEAASETEELPYTFEILAPWSAKEQLAPSTLPVDIIARGICFESDDPAQSTEDIRTIIQGEDLTASYILFNNAEAFEQFQNYIFIANVFAYVFIAIISLIAVANVFNTISTNIRLRRRELAMLRSVGMSDADFNKMMRFECVFYGMKALMIGIPLSLLFSVLIIKVMMTDEDARFMTLPWGSVVISALFVFLIIFITMMYSVSKIRKENIIDALRDEMT